MIRLEFKDIKSNIDDLERFISSKTIAFLYGEDADKALNKIGKAMKKNVLNAPTPYDLNQSGQFLRALRSSVPGRHHYGSGDKHLFLVGFGELEKLSSLRRPEQSVAVRDSTGKSRKINIQGEPSFPYWIAIEFGILSKRDRIPKRFRELDVVTKKGKKSSTPYSPIPFGESPPKGHKKGIFLMLPTGNTHPGIEPSRLFRKGLATTFPEVHNQFEKFIKKHWDNI